MTAYKEKKNQQKFTLSHCLGKEGKYHWGEWVGKKNEFRQWIA